MEQNSDATPGQNTGQPPGDAGEGLKELKESLSTLVQSVTVLSDGLAKLDQKIENVASSNKPKDEPPVDDYSDLEVLSRKDFMDLIMQRIGKVIDDKLSEVSKQVENVQTSREEEIVREQVEKAAKKYKDFWDWRDEMKKLVERNPYLTAEDAYILARSSNPEKAKEIDAKYSESDEKEEKEKKETPVFGGLTPTSGRTTESDKMTQEDAAETAWRRVFGGSGEETIK